MTEKAASSDAELRAGATKVLTENRRDGYTVPAIGLYPYQWCWDSGPIALGWAQSGDWEQAWRELESLMSAQWPSGMVPHIVFWVETEGYFPGPGVWRTKRNPETSGITQPPLPASAAVRLYQQDPDRTRAESQFRALWPRLVAWLSWLARARRGPHGGIVAVHPWETGWDNAPTYDDPLDHVKPAKREHLHREDLKAVSAAQRPTDDEYLRYIAILHELRDAEWDTEAQIEASPFAVEDLILTSLTARAAADMVEVAPALGLDAGDLESVRQTTTAALRASWRDDNGWFHAFDVKTERWLDTRTASGLLPLWARAATSDQVEQLVRRLDEWRGEVRFAIPTTDPTAPAFDAVRYWRGPVWVIVNWMVADGLAAYGHHDRADALRAATHDRVAKEGFREYYDARSGEGIGGEGFSWSAALTLAWLTAPQTSVQAP